MDTADAFQVVLDYMREAVRHMAQDDAVMFTEACNILEDIAVNE
jgi:hypothetical protein